MVSASIGTIVSYVAAAASAAAAIGSAYSQKQASDFNAEKAMKEAKVAREQEEIRLRKIRGAAEAATGASGITGEGSPLDIMQANAITSEQNALMIQYGGLQQSSIMKSQGDNAMTEGYFKAGTTLLSAAGRSYSSSNNTKTDTGTSNVPVPQFKPKLSGY